MGRGDGGIFFNQRSELPCETRRFIALITQYRRYYEWDIGRSL